MVDKEKILAGRKAVDAYRIAHTKLYEHGWHKGIPEKHTPLLNIMLKTFKGLGFNTIQEFFDASLELNKQDIVQMLGFADIKDFKARATKADWEVYHRMWH